MLDRDVWDDAGVGKAEPTRFHAWEGGQLDGPGCMDWEQTRWNLCRRAGRSLLLGREDFYSEVSKFFFSIIIFGN